MTAAVPTPLSRDEAGTRRPLWLNVASSVEVLEGYLNLDNGLFYRLTALLPLLRLLPLGKYTASIQRYRDAKRRGRVMMHDCRAPLPFPNGSVDHILCSHFLEHVYPEEARAIVRDFHRVLRPGGTVHLIVPNVRHLAETYLRDGGAQAASVFIESTLLSARARPSWRFRLLEALGFEGLKHRWMYDDRSLTELVVAAGFRLVSREHVPSAEYRAWDGEASAHVVGVK